MVGHGGHRGSEMNPCYLKMLGKSVKLKMGDITDEIADVIVNFTNNTLNNAAGVSGAILTAAGASVTEECKQFGTMPNDGLAVTGAGKLKCKKIIHVVGPKHTAAIVTSLQKVLQQCEKDGLNTIAIPAVGTGQACIDIQSSITSIFHAIEKHLSGCPTSCLKEICIIAFTQIIYQHYLTEFQSRISNSQITNGKICGKSIILKHGDITAEAVDGIVNISNSTWKRSRVSDGESQEVLPEDQETKQPGQGESCTQTIFPEKGDWGTVSSGQPQRSGDPRHGYQEEYRLADAAVPTDSIAVTGAGNLRSKKIIHIMGSNNDYTIPKSVKKALQECERHSLKTVALPAIGTGQAAIDPNISIHFILDGITTHLTGTPDSCLQDIFIIAVNEDVYQKYSKVFEDRCTDVQATREQNPRHSVIIDIPPSWTDMGSSEFMAVTLQEDSQEYKEVEGNFVKTSTKTSVKVIKVERIQDLKQWQSYTVKMQAVNRKYPNQLNERHLYHGTSFDVTKKINHHGFNRSFCGKNGKAYGQGTYFAKEAYYSSHDKFSVPDQDENKYVYQAAVITGTYCAGKQSYKEPPRINEDSEADLYNCVVDKVNNPFIFVVFCDDGAYPEYLITFKTLKPTA
ncbi:protein mono-ADP-ribosyltransferase PARP15-like [Discoglossus pictus]